MGKLGWENLGDHPVVALFTVVGGVMAVLSFVVRFFLLLKAVAWRGDYSRTSSHWKLAM